MYLQYADTGTNKRGAPIVLGRNIDYIREVSRANLHFSSLPCTLFLLHHIAIPCIISCPYKINYKAVVIILQTMYDLITGSLVTK